MTTKVENKRGAPAQANLIGLTKADYRGNKSTLCQGCGHNSISSQIISACHEMSISPDKVIKLSGIGCSSKSPAYFMGRSHGFNSLHGRMPTIATGAVLANHELKAIGVSGDGDTASIGLGHFIHLVRRNVPMVYIVENNGVYGLTKGQFSATADQGQELKKMGINPFMPVDICMEALIAKVGFVARSFAGDPKQVKELLKAALHFKGTAVLDIISPCVTFNNRDASTKSYAWGKEHRELLHDVTWVPKRDDIEIVLTIDGAEDTWTRKVGYVAAVVKEVAPNKDINYAQPGNNSPEKESYNDRVEKISLEFVHMKKSCPFEFFKQKAPSLPNQHLTLLY